VCPTKAIKFVDRWNRQDLKVEGVPEVSEVPLSRRGLLGAGLGGVAAFVATRHAFGAGLGDPGRRLPIRPPGSVPEPSFLALCIRCDACIKACPNDCLQPMGFGQGLEGLWTPEVVPRWSGCEPSCNNCGQVCPTGAIRALTMDEKRAARIGLALVNERTCLPYAGREACQMCVDECRAAGYHAIEFVRVHAEVDEKGAPVPGSGLAAPVVLADKCVGCGLCETRCHAINVQEKRLLSRTAIEVFAGEGKEDRLARGSYLGLRAQEQRVRSEQVEREAAERGTGAEYLPEFLRDK
jgi:ferredoxin